LLIISLNEKQDNGCNPGGDSWMCKFIELAAVVQADRRFNTFKDLGETIAHARQTAPQTNTSLAFEWGEDEEVSLGSDGERGGANK